MLQKLSLFDYALVDRVELELGEGLNLITGETGAGKSILVGAIAALLGEKAAFNAAREDAKKAVVEGLFLKCGIPAIKRLLQAHEIETGADHSLLIRREFHPTGRSRAFINDTPVPAAVLDELAEHLADLHGQHEHQSLLRPRTHLDYLDTFADLGDLRAIVTTAYESVQTWRQRCEELLARHTESRTRHDFELFQLQELKQVQPQLGEEEALEAEAKLLGNAARRLELSGKIGLLLYEGEHAVQAQLKIAFEALNELTLLDPSLQNLVNDCKSTETVLREVGQEVQRYHGGIALNEQRHEQVRQRLVSLQKLKRKYGGSLVEVLRRWEELENSLAQLENFDAALAELQKNLGEAEAKFAEHARKLSQQRQTAAKQLEQAVPEVLAELGLQGTVFQVKIEQQPQAEGFVFIKDQPVKAGRSGIDQVEFYLSTNKGLAPGPLAKVASGGEISRIMLALKSINAERDEIPVLVFDEIDSGVSGRVAQAVGRRLQKLAESHQILCISHLPQIASAGRYHFLVEKTATNGRTATTVRRLTKAERPLAIAKLLGGEKISETHLKSAEELLAEAGNG
ncbi:MAG: DNA repair protein RecN [candidate division KSB1 bacterium]